MTTEATEHHVNGTSPSQGPSETRAEPSLRLTVPEINELLQLVYRFPFDQRQLIGQIERFIDARFQAQNPAPLQS